MKQITNAKTYSMNSYRVIENTPRNDMLPVIGDTNAKVGRGLDGEEGNIGLYGLEYDKMTMVGDSPPFVSSTT